jgi:four helix bundle protein
VGKPESFEDLLVWQKSMDLVASVYQTCCQEPLSKDWGLRDQIQRAAVSVSANIAEGYERDSRREFIHFLRIAKGSVGELRCLFRIGVRLKYIPEQRAQVLVAQSAEDARMLNGLVKSLS